MKTNKKSNFRKKCLSEKYYASIKYMSHALKGNERRDFIKRVCDINIYLGCQCAMTCEQDNDIDNYIRKTLDNFFKPHIIKYYNSKEKKRINIVKKLRSFDIANYLLACNLIGKKKALNWYIYNHPVHKSILIQLAAEMNEDQLLDFMLVILRSEYNKDKLRGIGSAKNLYQKKNDKRLENILSMAWNIDKDAYIQLEYDTGLLQDLWTHHENGKSVYIHLLNKCVKQKLALDYLTEVLGTETMVKILEKSVVGERFLYLIYLKKLQNRQHLTPEEYDKAESLPIPPDKICNYYIPFFLNLRNSYYMPNVDYSRLFDSFGKLYTPLDDSKSKAKVSGKKEYNREFERIVKSVSPDSWNKIVELYFKTCISETTSFDELFRNLNKYYGVQIDYLLQEISSYNLKIVVKKEGVQFCRVMTENYIKSNKKEELFTGSEVHISDYDYINGIVYVERTMLSH